MKKQIFTLVTLLIGIVICSCFSLPNLTQKKETPIDKPVCPPLPDKFSDTDLVGTWVAEYFGGDAIDKLVIRADGTYQQIFSSNWLNFQSDWKNWRLESRPDGFVLLHLDGMRRCDDVESICSNPGGGLPNDEVAINQCNEGNEGYISYSGEVILFVTGYARDVPREIVLRQARLAGSDWTYSFRLDESVKP